MIWEPPNGSPNRSKSDLGRHGPPPSGRKRSPGGLQGAISRALGAHVGAMFELFQSNGNAEAMFAAPPFFFAALVTCPAGRSCCHAVPDAQGWRVPALALTIKEKTNSMNKTKLQKMRCNIQNRILRVSKMSRFVYFHNSQDFPNRITKCKI